MKSFSYSIALLLFATMIFSSCGVSEDLTITKKAQPVEVDAGSYLTSQKAILPDNCFYVDTTTGSVVSEAQPSVSDSLIKNMSESGGILTVDGDNPSLWNMTIPDSLQKLDTRGGGRDGVCLYGFEYWVVEDAECSSANWYDIDLIFNQGTFATGKFITLEYPWMQWGLNGELVQAGLQSFADSVYYGLLDIGVPLGFGVCVFATAWDDPTSGNHVYTIALYVNGVPPGVHVSFSDIFIVNCNGGGYANYDNVDLGINQFCSNHPPTCLAIGGGN